MRSLRRGLLLASVAGFLFSCSVNQTGLTDDGGGVTVDSGNAGTAGASATAGHGGSTGSGGTGVVVTGTAGNASGGSAAGASAGNGGRGGAGGNVGIGGNVGSTGGAGAGGAGDGAGSGGVGGAGDGAGTGGVGDSSGSGGVGGAGDGGVGGAGNVGGIGGVGGAGNAAGSSGLAGSGGNGAGGVAGSNGGRGGTSGRGGNAGTGVAGRGGTSGRGGTGGNPCVGYPSGAKAFVTPTDNRTHCYWPRSSSQTWSEAQASCTLQNGYLVTILSAEENAFVVSIAQFSTSFSDTWIGATDGKMGGDKNGPGTYKWVTNETWGYSNWEQGQPDGFCDPCSLGQTCTCDHRAVLSSNGTWNDRWQDNNRSSVCEAIPN